MGILTIPLGMGIKNSPVTKSPYVDINEIPDITPIPPAPADLLTETGFFILAEDSSFITTE